MEYSAFAPSERTVTILVFYYLLFYDVPLHAYSIVFSIVLDHVGPYSHISNHWNGDSLYNVRHLISYVGK